MTTQNNSSTPSNIHEDEGKLTYNGKVLLKNQYTIVGDTLTITDMSVRDPLIPTPAASSEGASKEKSLELLSKFIRETPKDELDTIIKKVQELGIEGPTFSEYLNVFSLPSAPSLIELDKVFDEEADVWKAEFFKQDQQNNVQI